jgi:hypothetical protein
VAGDGQTLYILDEPTTTGWNSRREVGDVFLLFYGPGPIEPRNILGTLSQLNAVTARSRQAFAPAPRVIPDLIRDP